MIIFYLAESILLRNMHRSLILIFSALLVAASIQDIKKHEISKYILLLQLCVCLISLLNAPIKKVIEILPIVAGVLAVYILNIIGGGDAKVFILSAILYDPHIVFLSIISTLAILLIFCRLENKKVKKIPLVAVFTITLTVFLAADILGFGGYPYL